MKKDDTLIIKVTGQRCRIERILYNPYLPKFLCRPKYLVHINGYGEAILKSKNLLKFDKR